MQTKIYDCEVIETLRMPLYDFENSEIIKMLEHQL